MPAKMDDEFNEEFEPLFDYSRVQPSNYICLDDDDDDDDEDVVCLTKKIKTSHSVENEKKNDVKAAPVVNLDDKDDDDDWLPPPPKVSSDAQKTMDDDSTLRKLRLKKQELVSFAESAKDLLKTVEESAKRAICDSLKTFMDGTSENTSKPSDERAKILISVQDKNETKHFRMFMDDKFERIVKTYAETMRCGQNQIVLSFDGEKVGSSETPASLGMEDGDIIEVHVKSS